MQEGEYKDLLRKADAVCFDVDSTVITGEGIDELAAYCGVGEEVTNWTNKAMGGGVTFRVSLHERLKIINPSQNQLAAFIKESHFDLTEGVQELIFLLQQQNKDIYLVSGGFHSIIRPIADKLKIDHDNIIANKLMFDSSGNYAGFDETQPTSETGGKKVVVEGLIQKHGYKNLVTIGDGITDYETYPPARLFIGFGGNRVREKVKQQAPWFVYHFKELVEVLKM